MNKFGKIFFIVFLFVALTCVTGIHNILTKYKQNKELYENSRNYVTVSDKDDTLIDTISIDVDFEKLEEINDDIIGWIYIPDTNINYPLVKGDDNQYYVEKGYDNSVTGSGAIFLDYRNSYDLKDYNSIIYGHNMIDDTMFSDLARYMEQEYFEQHRLVYIVAKDKMVVYEVFSAYITTSDSDTYTIDFGDETENYLLLVNDKNILESDSVIDFGDRIITLSTCTSSTSDGRYVVHAFECE